MKLLDRMIPIQRPSAVITISSAALWHTGVIESIDRILWLLQAQGADTAKAMASRGDPCMDIVLPESLWTMCHRTANLESYWTGSVTSLA